MTPSPDPPLDTGPLRDAIAALADALAVIDDEAWFDAQPERVRNTVIAGAIQSVEFVYELGVKTLRRAMQRRAASPAEIEHPSFRDMIRTAADMRFLAPDEVTAWFGYRDMRAITAHTYDRAKAQTVLNTAPAFLADARRLLERIDGARA